MRKRVIAVDFDGTMAVEKYPLIGPEIPGSIEGVKRLQELGYEVVIWTCREGEPLEMAKKWLSEKGVDVKYFNENTTAEIEFWKTDPRKVAADFYVDDRVVGGFPGWDKVIKWAEVYLLSEGRGD